MFEYPVVFVDIETTGGSYQRSRVLEVAAIRYEDGQVTREFSTLINPETYIPSSITSLTGITASDVVDAPVFEAIADELFDVIEGAVFVAHNVRFDYTFLKNEFARIGISFTPKLLCTVRLSRSLYAHHKGHSLQKLIERHSIPFQKRHRALDDAMAILYFSQLAFDEHGSELFSAAVNRQLKTQYLPPYLDMDELDRVENIAGVYVFEDENHQPLYVGKSVSLKKRILSHFQSQSLKELKISQNVRHVKTIPTGSELAALILESKMVKELQPLYNRMLRRVSSYAMLIKYETEDGYAAITIKSGKPSDESDLTNVYGVYENRTKAKRSLEDITRLFQLCPKLMGLEKTKGGCFFYSLHKCNGACVGEEPAERYNRRLEVAMERNRIALWPYKTPIAIPLDGEGRGVVIRDWMIQGFYEWGDIENIQLHEPAFELDEYKIIRRFVRENVHLIRPLDISINRMQITKCTS